jgi:hypothetical protein
MLFLDQMQAINRKSKGQQRRLLPAQPAANAWCIDQMQRDLPPVRGAISNRFSLRLF